MPTALILIDLDFKSFCCGNSEAELERMLKPASSPSFSKTFQSDFLDHLLAPGLEGSRPLVISEGLRP